MEEHQVLVEQVVEVRQELAALIMLVVMVLLILVEMHHGVAVEELVLLRSLRLEMDQDYQMVVMD